MKNLIRIGLFTAMLTLPVYAYAQEEDMPQKGMPAMNCPMMGHMMSMHKDMHGMMGKGMMGGSMMQDDAGAETDAAPETPEDHESHH